MAYGVATDYEYRGKRDRVLVWSGAFYSVLEASGLSLPSGGYMLTTYNGDKIRVSCPSPRTDENFLAVDEAIDAALRAHYAKAG